MTLEQLRAALARALDTPPAIEPALEAIAAREDPFPDPWHFWTAVCLARHRPRQLWLEAVVRERLRGEPAAIGAVGAFGHPEGVADRGGVPGLPGWVYELHGRGCCLVETATGVAIDVDFHDGAAEHIDPYFYIGYLRSLARAGAEPCEARLLALHPAVEPIRLAYAALAEAHLLEYREGSRWVFRIAPGLVALQPELERFATAFADPTASRAWLAAAVGDWPEAARLHPALPSLAQRAARCEAERRARLEGMIADEELGRLALHGLGDLDPAAFPSVLLRVLERPIDRTTITALDLLLEAECVTEAVGALEALFARLDPQEHPYLVYRTGGVLLDQGCERSAILPRVMQIAELRYERFVDNPYLDDLALIALEHAPERALGLVRRALRSAVPISRQRIAAALALLAEPWCVRELRALLHETSDSVRSSECRAALRRCGELGAIAVEHWEAQHPFVPSSGPPYTFADLVDSSGDSWFEETLGSLRERVERLRGRLPDGFGVE